MLALRRPLLLTVVVDVVVVVIVDKTILLQSFFTVSPWIFQPLDWGGYTALDTSAHISIICVRLFIHLNYLLGICASLSWSVVMRAQSYAPAVYSANGNGAQQIPMIFLHSDREGDGDRGSLSSVRRKFRFPCVIRRRRRWWQGRVYDLKGSNREGRASLGDTF